MNDRIPEDKPTRVPARASRWWNPSSAIDLAGTERLTDNRGDRAKSALLLEREPTDWKAGCGRSARPVWREGERTPALPTPITPDRRITRGRAPAIFAKFRRDIGLAPWQINRL